MLDFQRDGIEKVVENLVQTYQRTYGGIAPEYGNVLGWVARLALENIANSDALYHNVEHTVMVTLAGQSILEGKHLAEGDVTPLDWLHYMMAVLLHDIGYVRGICRLDNGNRFATGIGDQTVVIPEGSSDAALTPYHVDRGQQFVRERFARSLHSPGAPAIDVNRIAQCIEMTRFPVPKGESHRDTTGFGGLVRGADFVGQLGDPNYLRKLPALFYEFEEIGINARHGYTVPGDLRRSYSQFYWEVVSPYIRDALYYLGFTKEGKQWVANLNSHVFMAEHFRAVGM